MSGFTQSSYFVNGVENPYGFINPVYITNYNDFKYTIGAGLNDTDNTLSTVGNPAIQLTSNSLYANDNQVSIQSQINNANQADVVYVSAGSYGERMVINNKYNMAITAPYVGNSICEVLNGLEITGTSEIIRISNIQFEGTGSVINGQGRHYLNRVSFQGALGNINTLTISGFGAGKFITLENCEFDNYCAITIANTFAGVLYFINCNFGGASITLSQFSNQQVIFNNCAGFSSFPTRSTFFGMNVLTTGESRNTSTTLDSPYFLIGGVSTISSLNQVLTTDGENGVKLTPMGGAFSFYNVMNETSQQTVKNGTSASPIVLYSRVDQGNLIQGLNCIVEFIANFSTTQDGIITFKFIDSRTPLSPLATVIQMCRANGTPKHFHIPINFNFPLPVDSNTLTFSITASIEAGDIDTDTNDFYSITFNEIKGA